MIKTNIVLAIAISLVGLITGLFLTLRKVENKNNKLEIALSEKIDSLNLIKPINSLQVKTIENLQKDFLVYRDSFLLYKRTKPFNNRIITIHEKQKCLSKKILIDTIIVNKITYEKIK